MRHPALIKREGPEIPVPVPPPSDNQSRSPAPAGEADPVPRPTRRVFTPAYKLATVAEYENTPNGQKGAILRREGLYSSHIIEWTRARDAGVLSGNRQSRRPRRNASRKQPN
jgi:transposase